MSTEVPKQETVPVKKIQIKKKPKKPTKEEMLKMLPEAIKEISEVIDGIEKELEQVKPLNLKYLVDMAHEALETFEEQQAAMQEELDELQSS